MKCFSYAFGFCVALWLINQLTLCSGQVSVCRSSGTQTLTSSSGEIASHSGVGVTNYRNNMRCYWQIRAPSGYKIFLRFAYINLESCCDKVTLYDGSSSSARITVATGTSTSSLGSYASTSNLMTVYFRTDGSVVRRGFRVLYMRSGNESRVMSSCGSINFTSPSNTTGVISSHDSYGITPYAPDMSCSWTLPELSGHYMNLTVTAMALGSGDCLRLSSNSAIVISPNTSYCGPRPAFGLLRQMAGHVRIEFNSNDHWQSNGFQIYFRYKSYCFGNKNLSSASGEIVSHSIGRSIGVGMTRYWNDMRCFWQINAPRGKVISAWFSYMDLESCDTVTLYDGGNGSTAIATVSSRASSSYVSPRYLSTSNVMTVYFQTSSSYPRYGFRLQYRTMNSSEDSSCGKVSFTSPSHTSGLLRSHESYALTPYSANMSCSWTLPEQSGHYIHLSVASMSLGDGDCLRLASNSASSSSPNTSYCGWGAASGLSLRMRGDVQISFDSNERYESTGFQIRFQFYYFCHGTPNLTAESGEIQSHSGAGVTHYLNNMDCSWYITAPPWKHVKIRFSYFSLYSSSDRVTLYDGISGSSIATISGSSYVSLSRTYESSSNVMRVHFSTDGSGTSRGFKLQYNTSNLYCNGFKNVYAEMGEIKSHVRVGSRHYQNNMRCTWQITAPTGRQIHAWFTYIRLSSSSDSVTLIDGINGSSIATMTSGSSYTHRRYRSSSNVMTVQFSTDDTGTSYGIRLQFESKIPCNGTLNLTAESGEIKSHSGAGVSHYLNNMDCSWYITVPFGQVSVRFTYFSLHSYSDRVTLYDGISGSSIAMLRGSSSVSLSRTYESNSNVMRVHFSTDGSGTSRGFKLQYNTTVNYCYGFKNISAENGEIKSHIRVGSRYYLNNMRCNWQINAPEGKQVLVWFTYFSLSYGSDSVTLLNGAAGSSIARMTRYSSYTSRTFVSASSVMTVQFNTDSSGQYYGFRLRFDTTKSFCHGSQNLTAKSGEIKSHSDAGLTNYLNNMNCNWYITAPPGKQVFVRFTYFNLYRRYYYSSSHRVTLYDGARGSSIATLYGSSTSLSRIYESTSSVMRVHFYTDSSGTSLGFKLLYNITQNYCLGLKNVTAGDGEILSHFRVGRRSYLNNMRCNWQIRAPSGHRVAAWFSYMDLEGSDRVTLYDGANGSAVIAAVSRYYSSSYVSPRYVSTSNIMTVHFYTSASYTRNGFRLRYSLANDSRSSTCGRIEFTNASHASGLISSHDSYGSAPYPSNLSCSWTLPEMTGRYIHLSVTNMSLGAGDCLRINGNSTSGGRRIIRNYCGWTAASGIPLPMDGDVQFAFSSNSRYESSGFLVSFRYETACSGVKYLTHESGEIVSHSGVGAIPYPHNAKCSWMIIAPPGKQILVWFTYINLRSYSDTISLYDGNSDSRRLLTTSGSSGSSYVSRLFSSSLNFMTVRFNTGSSPTALGFRLLYSTRDEFCHGRRSLTAQSGEIASHQDANSTNYLKNMNCYWEITAPPGENVLARFIYIRLGSYSDRINLYDGTRGSRSLETVRGSSGFSHYISRIYSSSSSVMRIEFHTNSHHRSFGFRLRYSTTKEHCSRLKLLTAENGDVSSHNGVGRTKFLAGLTCYWRIVVPEGNRVLSEFTYMTLSPSDSITLYDGITGSSFLARVTGSSASSHISSKLLSSSNVMTVEFRTSSSSNSLGFTLKYNSTSSFCQGYRVVPAGRGEIASHSDAGVTHYVNNMRCYWQIRGQPGSQIYASISYRILESYTDTVNLTDGVTGSTLAIVRGGYGAGHIPPQFVTSSNVLLVQFSTDSSGTSLGFKLQYRSSGGGRSSTTTAAPKPLSTNTQSFISTTSLEMNSTDSENIGQQDGLKEFPVIGIAFSVAGPVLLIGLAALTAGLLYKRLRVPPSDVSKEQNCQHEKADDVRKVASVHEYIIADVSAARPNEVEDGEEAPYDCIKDVDLQV